MSFLDFTVAGGLDGFGGGSKAAPTYDSLGINTRAKEYFQQVQAALIRDDDDEFFRTYLGIQDNLLNNVNSPANMTRQVDSARLQARQGLQAGIQDRGMRQREYGLALSPERAAVQAKRDKSRAAVADVTATNNTVQRVRDRDWATMSGQPSMMGGLTEG